MTERIEKEKLLRFVGETEMDDLGVVGNLGWKIRAWEIWKSGSNTKIRNRHRNSRFNGNWWNMTLNDSEVLNWVLD